MNLYEVLAMAPPAEGAEASGWSKYQGLVMIGAMLVIMYMLLLRPQRKREAKRRELIASIKEKDEIVTIGGIYGKVTSVRDKFVIVDVGKGTTMKVSKGAVSRVIPPGEEDKGDEV